MPKLAKVFTIAAADVLTLDGTAVEIASFPDNDNVVRVPVRLEIGKEAGTAYDITYNASFPLARPVADIEGDFGSKGFITSGIGGGAYLVVRDDYGRPFFHVPADLLLATAAVSQFVAFPNLNGVALAPGRNTFSVIANVGIATGTGDITGRLYFDEYPVQTA